MDSWLDSSTHTTWLESQTRALLNFGRRVADPRGGAGWLTDDGSIDPAQPVHTYVTARMTHVYALGSLLGIPGSRSIAEQCMNGLRTLLHDDDAGGWFSSVDGSGEHGDGKSCYEHAFVLLAGSSAVQAGIAGADDLFAEAQHVFLDKFWRDADGLCVDMWDTAFTEPDDYRGLNANMHAVEAMLAAASASGDADWISRSERVCRFVVESSKDRAWRIPEHYDETWQPDLDLNRDQPSHPFKPFGATVGHRFEWARLMLHTEAAHETTSDWLLDAARNLFHRAAADGWSVDGAPGFVYTTDWDGGPVVRDRMHWVAAEAIAAAAALYRRTGDRMYADHYRRWWDYVATVMIDPVDGSWRHQLDERNEPTDTVWSGRPDLYHAIQATLIPRLPLYPMIATAVADGRVR